MSFVNLLPRISEKTAKQISKDKYTFLVPVDVDKAAIRQVIQKVYGVKIMKISTARMPGKKRRRGRVVGTTGRYKKTIVTLEKGQVIEQIKKLL